MPRTPKTTLPEMTPQQAVEYAAAKSDGLPEPLRLQVYWGTIFALALTTTPPGKKGSRS